MTPTRTILLLALCTALSLSAQPVAPTVAPLPELGVYNDTLIFKVSVVEGSGKLAYLWLKNSKPLTLIINGISTPQITDTLILKNTPDNVGLYRCRVFNNAGPGGKVVYSDTEQFRLSTTTSPTAASLEVRRKLQPTTK